MRFPHPQWLPGYQFRWQNDQILNEENNYYSSLVSEMWHIRSNNSVLSDKKIQNTNNLNKIYDALLLLIMFIISFSIYEQFFHC